MKANRVVAVAAGSLLALSVAGGVAVASGGGSSSGGSSTTTVQQDSTGSDNPEGTADQAAQDAACTAAGIDPTASNIQYDDASGVCTLDAGGDTGSDTAAEEGGGNESQADSDGPGGHQDPAGDVNHEFDGQE